MVSSWWQRWMIKQLSRASARVPGPRARRRQRVMTTVGGVGHALPYLIPDFWTATTIATIIVFVELGVISWIRYRYMDTPFLRAAFQVAVGGFLVFLAGIFIGNA